MARIILIETSTSRCSVGIAEDGICTHYKESPEPRAHAAMTVPYIKEVLDEAGLRVKDCDAVCVSKGPGSYTGLRVGSSTAKGLCFGAGIPLIAIGTLDILAAQSLATLNALQGSSINVSAIIPMIDARRMEVYTAVFSPDGRQLTPTVSTVITAGSFAAELAAGPVLFVGDGAAKCRPVLTSPNALFPDTPSGPGSADGSFTASSADSDSGRGADLAAGSGPDPFAGCPKASSMAALAEAAFRAGRFEDTAYFEPFYLKDFVAALPRNPFFPAKRDA